MTLSKEEIRSLRDYAVDQSLETIRNRIDQFGVSEPVIQREGQQEILIQLPEFKILRGRRRSSARRRCSSSNWWMTPSMLKKQLKNGPPPGRQILYGYVGKGEGWRRGEKTPYVVEARTLDDR